MSLILIGVLVGFFVLGWLASGSEVGEEWVRLLIYIPSEGWTQPWRMVSYALVHLDPWELLFVVLSLYFFGASIERAWGLRRFGWFLLLQVLVFSFVLWLYYAFSESSVGLSGTDLPACSLLVAWGSLYPSQQVLLWFVLPVRGAWIAWLAGLFPVFSYGWGRPLLGFLVGVPFVLVWAYVSGRLPKMRIVLPHRRKGVRESDYEGRSWERLREVEEERRRLKELFERSWGDEEGEGDGTKRED